MCTALCPVAAIRSRGRRFWLSVVVVRCVRCVHRHWKSVHSTPIFGGNRQAQVFAPGLLPGHPWRRGGGHSPDFPPTLNSNLFELCQPPILHEYASEKKRVVAGGPPPPPPPRVPGQKSGQPNLRFRHWKCVHFRPILRHLSVTTCTYSMSLGRAIPRSVDFSLERRRVRDGALTSLMHALDIEVVEVVAVGPLEGLALPATSSSLQKRSSLVLRASAVVGVKGLTAMIFLVAKRHIVGSTRIRDCCSQRCHGDNLRT